MFKVGDLIRDVEGDTYRVVTVSVDGDTIDIETTEGTPKLLKNVRAKFFIKKKLLNE